MMDRHDLLQEFGSPRRPENPVGDGERLLWLPRDLGRDGATEIGGKARGLLRLQQASLPVPPWCVMPASVVHRRPWREAGLPIDSLLRQLPGAAFGEWIVRSSAEGEDEARTSFAGVLSSQRFSAPEEFIPAIEKVLESAATPAVASYVRHKGSLGFQGLSVVIQKYVVGTTSGVLFSAHPTAGNPRRILVEAISGSGGGLEAGRMQPSYFEIELGTGYVVSARPSSSGPTTLAAELIAQLTEFSLTAEESFGTLLDIEWLVEDDHLWLVQARPVTSVRAASSLLPPFQATSWFFDQRFLEPIHPITATTLVPTIVRLAIAEPLAILSRETPEPLYALCCGQIYVRSSAYSALIGDLPLWALPPDLRQLCHPRNAWNSATGEHRKASRRISFFIQAAWIFVKNWKETLGNLSSWRRVKLELRQQCAGLVPAMMEDRGDWLARWNLLEEATVRVLRLHRWSVVLADYGFGVFQWITRRFPRKLAGQLDESIRLAASLPTIAANRGLRKVLEGAASSLEVDAFVATYGHRSTSLDFAVPTWGELLGARSAEAHGRPTPTPAGITPHKHHKSVQLLRPLVRLLELREEQRFEWERVLAEQRGMIQGAGAELAKRGVLDSPDLIWFLTWSELLGALFEGVPVARNELRLRRHEHRFNATVRKLPSLGEEREAIHPPGHVLMGVGASKGFASGRVHVLQTPMALDAQVPPGSVLVSRALDPGSTFLFQDAAAAILERGGILSHASILAREYGVPLVTSVENATELLTNGTQVSVDGDLGVVTIHA